jgi:hypothetical protein
LSEEGVNIYATSWGSLRNAISQHSWTVNNQKALVSPMTHVEYALSGIFNETVRASSSTSCSAVFANWKTAVDSVCANETVWVYWRNHILFFTVAGLSSFLMCSYLIYFYVLTHDPTLKYLYSQYLFKQQHTYLQTRDDDRHEDRVLQSDVVRARDAATRPEDPAPLAITSEQQPVFYPPLPLNSPSASPYAGTVTTSGVSPLSLNSIDGFGSSPGYILSPQQVALQRMWQQQQQTLQQQWHVQQRQQSFGGFAVGAMPLPLSPTNSIATSVTSQRTMTTIASAPPQPQPKEL